MCKSVIAALVGLSCAGIASAAPLSGSFNLLDPSMYTITATPLNSAELRGGSDPTWYSAITGPYNAFASATGNVGFDDYGTAATDDIEVTSWRFVGGVEEVGGTMSFQFFDSDSQFVDSFGVALPQAGAFIWTITISSGLTIPANGIVQAVVGEDFTGRWFLSATEPEIGTNDNTFGGANGGALSHRFEINGILIPTPGAMAVLGLAGLAATRRRR
jgi:hypothetical protein